MRTLRQPSPPAPPHLRSRGDLSRGLAAEREERRGGGWRAGRRLSLGLLVPALGSLLLRGSAAQESDLSVAGRKQVVVMGGLAERGGAREEASFPA